MQEKSNLCVAARVWPKTKFERLVLCWFSGSIEMNTFEGGEGEMVTPRIIELINSGLCGDIYID